MVSLVNEGYDACYVEGLGFKAQWADWNHIVELSKCTVLYFTSYYFVL